MSWEMRGRTREFLDEHGAAAILCSLRPHWLYAEGVVWLLKLDAEGRIYRSRYRGRNARDLI